MGEYRINGMGEIIDLKGELMPRIPRNNMETSFFHIIVQGIEKRYIFNEREDIEKYVNLLNKKNEENLIIAYCIMNNHAHILIKTEKNVYMEKWMQKVNTTFAKYFNKKYDRVGYVFRNRYKSQQIKSIKHLYTCVKYIHDNPVKAGICNKPDEYEYSSLVDFYNSNVEEVYSKLNKILNSDGKCQEIEKVIQKDDFVFMEYNQDKNNLCKEIVEKFKKSYNIDNEFLKNDKELLLKLIELLNKNYGISYRTIEAVTGLNREYLRRLIKYNESR